MSGINAHLILKSAGTDQSSRQAGEPKTEVLHYARCWPMPLQKVLLESVLIKHDIVLVQCNLSAARVAWLRDFQVPTVSSFSQDHQLP